MRDPSAAHAAVPWYRRGGPLALVAAALAGVLCAPLVVTNPTDQNFLILILMLAQLGVAWNIVGGYAGQVSLGHAAFYGLGAYTSTALTLSFGVNPWLGIPIGGLVAVLFALMIGGPCFRLKGHYFAMATIAVAEILQTLFTNWDWAGGAVGLTLPFAAAGWKTLVFNGKLPYYYLALGLLGVTLAANAAIARSFIGYYFRAIKDEPDAARSLGISLTRYKLIALCVSSFFTALGGSLYAQKELFIDPASTMSTALSIKMALVAILGGVGTLWGPVVGAVLLTAIEESSRAFLGGSGRGTDLIVYALLIIGVAVFYPGGIVGGLRSWWRRNQTAPAGPGGEAAVPSRQVAAPSGPLLEVAGVSRRFGGLWANQDVSFTLARGEIVGLIGPNGAGKTTLFHCIAGFMAPTSGAIRFRGEAVTGCAPEAISRLGVARTFQIVRTFASLTALENVMIGAFLRHRELKAARAHALYWLEFTGLSGRALADAQALTVAEQRRLQIARALATEPSLLLLDEAMAGLTPTEIRGAAELVVRIRELGITCLVVEHIMEAIMPIADRIVVLDGGRKIGDGKPAAIAADPVVLAAYLGA